MTGGNGVREGAPGGELRQERGVSGPAPGSFGAAPDDAAGPPDQRVYASPHAAAASWLATEGRGGGGPYVALRVQTQLSPQMPEPRRVHGAAIQHRLAQGCQTGLGEEGAVKRLSAGFEGLVIPVLLSWAPSPATASPATSTGGTCHPLFELLKAGERPRDGKGLG